MSRLIGLEGKCVPCLASNGGVPGGSAACGTSVFGSVPGVEAFVAPPHGNTGRSRRSACGAFRPGACNGTTAWRRSRPAAATTGLRSQGIDPKPGQFNAAFGARKRLGRGSTEILGESLTNASNSVSASRIGISIAPCLTSGVDGYGPKQRGSCSGTAGPHQTTGRLRAWATATAMSPWYGSPWPGRKVCAPVSASSASECNDSSVSAVAAAATILGRSWPCTGPV